MTPCAACHGTAHVSVFSGKIVSEVNVVVRTDNQSVPKIHIWLSVTYFLVVLDNQTTTITNPDCGAVHYSKPIYYTETVYINLTVWVV